MSDPRIGEISKQSSICASCACIDQIWRPILTVPADAYHAYTTTKSTIINYASADEMIASDDWFREGTGEVRYG